MPLSSRAPEVPAITTLLSVRSLTVAEERTVSAPEILAPPLPSMAPVTVRPALTTASLVTVMESLTVTSPVTARVEPLKVRLALSSRAPEEPAITTLLSVRSLTVAEERTVSAPEILAPPLPSI